MEVLSEYLLSVCDLCGQPFNTKTQRDRHMEICLNRHITLSLYYAEPLSHEIFEAKFGFEKNKDMILDHLTTQLAHIAERIRTTEMQPELADDVVEQIQQLEQNSFMKLLEEETSDSMISHPKTGAGTPSANPSSRPLDENLAGSSAEPLSRSNENLDELFGKSDNESLTSTAKDKTKTEKEKRKKEEEKKEEEEEGPEHDVNKSCGAI